MARRESDREDLLREATALVERAELTIEGFDEPIVVGFRRDGSRNGARCVSRAQREVPGQVLRSGPIGAART